MTDIPRRSSRSKTNFKSTTPSIETAPVVKRRKKTWKPFHKTMEALSKMTESTESSDVSNKYSKQFGGVQNIKLSDFSLEREIGVPVAPKKIENPAKSIYTGAGIKLDAFDCFHRALNQCVCEDYTFSIADAALILKQLTPDIIKKIVPMLSQQQCQSPKKKLPTKQTDKTEYYHGALDLEVTEINKDKIKNKNIKQKSSIKRPDVSRPTRMLSPGSNSCSPVSAAVQALISISAPDPILEGTSTDTNVKNPVPVTTYVTVAQPLGPYIKSLFKDDSSVFIPVSKPLASNIDFTDNVVTPVAKSAMSIPSEIPEVFVVTKADSFNDTTGFIMTSSLLDPISTQSSSQMISEVPTTINNLVSGSVSTNQIHMATTDQASKQTEQFTEMNHRSLTTEDPLPHFNLLLSSHAGLSSDISLPSPFQSHMPGSPMPPINLLNKHYNQDESISSFSMRNISTVPSQTTISYLEQSQNIVTEDGNPSNIRLQNQLRTILPKPYTETASVSVVSVLPSSGIVATNSVSQLSPVIKVDERKQMQYSVPPSQIFTKLNQVVNSNQFPAMSLAVMSPQQKPMFVNNPACFFPPHGVEALFYTQGKDFKPFANSSAMNLPFLNEALLKTKNDSNLSDSLQQNNPQASVKHQQKNENPGGNLEVASALLSMRTAVDSELEKTQSGDDRKNLEIIIQNSLKKESGSISISVSEQGIFKIEDVEIDPRKNMISLDNFQCGKCKRVFTSVLYLARHIKRVCPDMSNRKWKCDRCAKAFRHPFGLQQHIYTHTGERPHKCDQCAKAFYSANDLRRHIRTHSGERPYQCTHCEKRFSTTISLRTHTYIHTGERPHKCPHCTKTFATSSKLSRHVVTHSDKRPFPCDQCAKTFNRSGDLRRHYSQHHGKSHELLACDQCNKVFATQKCLYTHKTTHMRDFGPMEQQQNMITVSEEEELLKRTYAAASF